MEGDAMKRGWLFAMALLVGVAAVGHAEEGVIENVVLAIHGGIGLDKSEMTPEIDKAVRAGLEQALRSGYATLNKPNATGLDVVETAIRTMEDNPLFNAGKGAV